jgi:predicted NBD/HSP70 family sugar kinase
MRESFIGIDIGGSKMLIQHGDTTERTVTGPSFSPCLMQSQLRHFVTEHGLRPKGIGVAIPGLVDSGGRIVACDVLPHFVGWQPRQDLEPIGSPVAVMNDVQAALEEEMHDASSNITGGVVMAGTGIGAAFIVHGQPLLGTCGWAGELGYAPLVIDGQVQRLDNVASGASIAAKLGVTAAQLSALAHQGDIAALAAIREAGQALGIGLATVINLLNPSRLAVGGGALALPSYWAAAQNSAQQHSIPVLWDACTLSQVRQGELTVALGAVRFVSSAVSAAKQVR